MEVYIYIIVGMSASFLLCASLLLFYIRYRKGLLQQQYKLKEAEIRYQQELLHTMIRSQEQERHRIGMDLHDQVGATLSALRLMTELSPGQADKAGNDVRIRQQIDTVISHVRHIAHDLSPRIKGPDGLHDALAELFDTISLPGKLNAVLLLENDLIAPEGDAAMALYRVAGELASNTIRHAQAEQIELSCSRVGDSYMMDYRDNGIGMPPGFRGTSAGMGFRNIESRLQMIGATCDFPATTKGFHCLIHVPLTNAK